MKQIWVTEHEEELLRQAKEREENFNKMKRNGELFYIDMHGGDYKNPCDRCSNKPKPGEMKACWCTLGAPKIVI